jgi:HNH/ENDO VII superfamily nuclease
MVKMVSERVKPESATKTKAKVRKNRAPSKTNRNIDQSKTVENPDGSTTYFDKSGRAVTYNADGYPDFSRYSEATVRVDGLKGHYPSRRFASKQGCCLKSIPDGYTWRHVEDGGTMQLISTDIHAEFPHTGGAFCD